MITQYKFSESIKVYWYDIKQNVGSIDTFYIVQQLLNESVLTELLFIRGSTVFHLLGV